MENYPLNFAGKCFAKFGRNTFRWTWREYFLLNIGKHFPPNLAGWWGHDVRDTCDVRRDCACCITGFFDPTHPNADADFLFFFRQEFQIIIAIKCSIARTMHNKLSSQGAGISTAVFSILQLWQMLGKTFSGYQPPKMAVTMDYCPANSTSQVIESLTNNDR